MIVPAVSKLFVSAKIKMGKPMRAHILNMNINYNHPIDHPDCFTSTLQINQQLFWPSWSQAPPTSLLTKVIDIYCLLVHVLFLLLYLKLPFAASVINWLELPRNSLIQTTAPLPLVGDFVILCAIVNQICLNSSPFLIYLNLVTRVFVYVSNFSSLTTLLYWSNNGRETNIILLYWTHLLSFLLPSIAL